LEHSLLSFDIGHLALLGLTPTSFWTRVGASRDVLSKINNLSMGPFPRSVDILCRGLCLITF